MRAVLIAILLQGAVVAIGCDVPCPVHKGEKFTTCRHSEGHLDNAGYMELFALHEKGKLCAETERPGSTVSNPPAEDEERSIPREAGAGRGNGGLVDTAGKVLGAIGGFVRDAIAGQEGDHDASDEAEGGTKDRELTTKRGTGGKPHFCGPSNPPLGGDGAMIQDMVYSLYTIVEDGKYIASKPGGKAVCTTVLTDGQGEILGKIAIGALFAVDGKPKAIGTRVKGAQLGKTGKEAKYNYEAWPPIGDPRKNPVTWVLDTDGGCPCNSEQVATIVEPNPEDPDQVVIARFSTARNGIKDEGKIELGEDQDEIMKLAEVDNLEPYLAGAKSIRFIRTLDAVSREFGIPIAKLLRGKEKLADLLPPSARRVLEMFALENEVEERSQADDDAGPEVASSQSPANAVEEDTTSEAKEPQRVTVSIENPEEEAGEPSVPSSSEKESPRRAPKARSVQDDPKHEHDEEHPPVSEKLASAIEKLSERDLRDFVALSEKHYTKEEIESMDLERVREIARHACEVKESTIMKVLCGATKEVKWAATDFFDIPLEVMDPTQCFPNGK